MQAAHTRHRLVTSHSIIVRLSLAPSVALSVALTSALSLACGTGARTGDESPDASTSQDASTPSVACSVENVTGATPSVRISIRSSKCAYRSGEHAEFTYEVTTDATVPPIEVQASQGCGSCSSYSSDPMSFVKWSISGTSNDGRAQQYCLCDTGCCAPDTARSVKVDAATRSATIAWSGHVWQGPSDTNSPEGAAFAPGHYDVIVAFGSGVRAKLPITIVP